MVTVEVLYPGKVFQFECNQESAEWLQAQFKGKEWIHAKILQPTRLERLGDQMQRAYDKTYNKT